MILHKSKYVGDLTLDKVCEELSAISVGSDEYKAEFVSLIEKLCGNSEKV